jgi:hypothetical protein
VRPAELAAGRYAAVAESEYCDGTLVLVSMGTWQIEWVLVSETPALTPCRRTPTHTSTMHAGLVLALLGLHRQPATPQRAELGRRGLVGSAFFSLPLIPLVSLADGANALTTSDVVEASPSGVYRLS